MDTVGITCFVLLFCLAVYLNDWSIIIIGFLGGCFGIYQFNESKKIDLGWQKAIQSGIEIDIAVAELEAVNEYKKNLE